MRFRKLKKCPACKENDFRIREATVYHGELNRETGMMDVKKVASEQIIDVFCRNCGEPFKFHKVDFDFTPAP